MKTRNETWSRRRSPDKQLFGAVLRSRREELALTQASLCRTVRRSQSWLSRYERGQFYKIPTLLDVRVVCAKLNLNPVELLYECGFLSSDEIESFARELQSRASRQRRAA